MAKVRFLWENLIDLPDTVITPSTEDANFQASNLANAHITKVWKTGDTGTDDNVVFNVVSSLGKPVNAIVIDNHNLPSAYSYFLQGNTADSWGSPTFSRTLTQVDGKWAEMFPGYTGLQYWRFNFTKAVSSVRQVGRIFIGDYYEVEQDPTPEGVSFQFVDLSTTSESAGGQSYSDIKGSRQEITLTFNNIPDTQYDEFKVIAQTVGTHTPFFISINHDTDPQDWLFYVKFKEMYSMQINAVGTTRYWNVTMTMTEQL